MTNLENEHNKSDFSNLPDGSASFKHQVESALQQTELRVERSVPLRNGTKVPQAGETGHTDTDNHRRPTVIDGNCSLHTGHNLLAIDVDDHDAFPGKVKSLLQDTLTITSPHGGEHLLYHVPDDTGIKSADLPNGSGEIRYDGYYVVCPGSYLDHSNCDSDKSNCPGNGTDQYQPANDLPIATLTEAEHPELLEWLRKLGGGQQSTSGSTSATSNTQQELDPLDQDHAEEQFKRFYNFIHDEVGDAGRQAIDHVLSGSEEQYVDHDGQSSELKIDLIATSDDGSIDRSHADYYALSHLYGGFICLGDSESEARQNAIDVFRYFIERKGEHSDEQPRKLNDHNNPRAYLEKTMNSIQENFDLSEWFHWYNWEHFPDNNQSDNNHRYDHSNGRSRLSKNTLLAAIEWLTSFDGEQTVSIDYLQKKYQADFEQVEVEQLPSTPSSTLTKQHHICISGHPPHQSSHSHSNRVYTGSAGEQENERVGDRIYPTGKEVRELAHQLNPDRSTEHFRSTLSEMVNDPDPLVTVVQAKCPSRSNGDRYVYYLDRESDGDRDPADAECVKLHGRELEPETREPIVDGESTHEEEI